MKETKLMGILNVTPNSFSDGGSFDSSEKALIHFNKLIEDGADLIDIGAQSTSYGAEILSPENEWDRLKDILIKIENKSVVSIDTFNLETMKNAYDLGYRIFNDVKAGHSEEVLKFISENNDITYIAMFSLVIPADKNVRINSLDEINIWANAFLEKAQKFGIEKDRIILDPGVSFVTNPSQSLELLSNPDFFDSMGCKTLFGHSRKSFFETMTKLPPKDRDIETLAASLHMYGKVDYLRVHNVEIHKRAFETQKILKNSKP